MGTVSDLGGQRVYLDANIFIYLIEGYPPLAEALDQLKQALEDGQIVAVTSVLTLTELLPPLAEVGDQPAMQAVVDFVQASGFFVVYPLDDATCIQAGILRGTTKLKTPDALHVATAIEAECDVFLTNDKKMDVPHSLPRLLLSDLV